MYEGIESVLREEGYEISVSVTRNRGFIECLSDFGIDFQEDWIRWYSPRDMEEKLSKKGLQRMYRRTKDCTAMILYNDEVAGSAQSSADDRGFGLAGKEVFVPVSGNV